jgi:hypothetical protein
MMGSKIFLAATAGALLLLPLAACSTSSGSGSGLGTTTLPVPSARPTSVTPGSVQDPQLASALDAAARHYWTVENAVYNDPRTNMGLVDSAATGQWAVNLRYQGQQIIDKNLKVTGTTVVVRTNIASVTPSPVVSGQPATAVVKTCNDVSAIQFTNPDGSSGTDPHRLPQNQATLTLTSPNPTDPAAWRVSDIAQGATVPCDSAS